MMMECLLYSFRDFVFQFLASHTKLFRLGFGPKSFGLHPNQVYGSSFLINCDISFVSFLKYTVVILISLLYFSRHYKMPGRKRKQKSPKLYLLSSRNSWNLKDNLPDVSVLEQFYYRDLHQIKVEEDDDVPTNQKDGSSECYRDLNQIKVEGNDYLQACSINNQSDGSSVIEKPDGCNVVDTPFDVSHYDDLIPTCSTSNNQDYSETCKNDFLRSSLKKPFACTLCDKEFNSKRNLTRHMRVHTGDKPYSCTHCDYTCRRKQHLTLHMRTHTGDRPFSCSLCNYTCSRKHHLLLLIRIHTGDRSFSCTHCDYACSRKHQVPWRRR